jgi:hypothetical protein
MTTSAGTQGFGVFAALVIAVDYIFVMSIFCTAVLVFHDRLEKHPLCSFRFQPAPCTLPLHSAPYPCILHPTPAFCNLHPAPYPCILHPAPSEPINDIMGLPVCVSASLARREGGREGADQGRGDGRRETGDGRWDG